MIHLSYNPCLWMWARMLKSFIWYMTEFEVSATSTCPLAPCAVYFLKWNADYAYWSAYKRIGCILQHVGMLFYLDHKQVYIDSSVHSDTYRCLVKMLQLNNPFMYNTNRKETDLSYTFSVGENKSISLEMLPWIWIFQMNAKIRFHDVITLYIMNRVYFQHTSVLRHIHI